MSVGINLPVPVPNPWNISHNKNVLNQQIHQSHVDNAFRNQQFHTQQDWNWRKWNDRKFKIQNLVKDAQKAGVSPLAALGAGGSAPINVSMPVGQGGRVSGNYQRQSTIEASISTQIQQQSHLQTLDLEEQVRGRRLDNAIKNLEWEREYNRTRNPQHLKLYEPAVNNYEEAVKWVNDGLIPTLNRDLNFEMPESVGGYYFGKPHPEGWLNNIIK